MISDIMADLTVVISPISIISPVSIISPMVLCTKALNEYFTGVCTCIRTLRLVPQSGTGTNALYYAPGVPWFFLSWPLSSPHPVCTLVCVCVRARARHTVVKGSGKTSHYTHMGAHHLNAMALGVVIRIFLLTLNQHWP